MKTRIDLARHFNKLGFKTGAEIGVLGGAYSVEMCKAIPGLKLYCIDKWGRDENRYRTYHERKFEEAKIRLAPYNCELIRKFSMEAVTDFADNSLDFVYIDADHHYQNVKNDITEWAKKVRIGGIVAGHDYLPFKLLHPGVIEAVDEYVKEHNCKLELTEWNNRGRNRDNFQPSWFFTKED